MGNIKQVQQILPPPPAHMVGDGFRVHNFFPSGYDMDIRRMSPFFMLDYNSKIDFAPTKNPRGVGVHPHRGFETVTIAYKGKVSHHDSSGNSGTIGEGDVQWMTAGSGVLHKEYHEKGFSEKGGEFHMVQLWVNLPAKFKMTKPQYQAITNSMMAKYVLPNNGGIIDIVAGEYDGIKGPASTFTPLHLFNAKINKGGGAKFSFPANYNTGFLVVEGNVKVNEEETAPVDNFILFKNEGEEITVEANEDAVVLVLSGEPINEPIMPYGPFVMNTKEEIVQAYDDLKNGKFGKLED